MLCYKYGDIFTTSAQCLVNPVNCNGVMGKGLAYLFKKRFPKNNADYVKVCRSKKLRIGTVHIFKENNKIIVNFPTKVNWWNKSKLEYIEKGMKALVRFITENNVNSIAFSALGCGNGGLSWESVNPIMIKYLKPLSESIDIYIYEPLE